MQSQSETTNDEPIRYHVTTQTPASFAHVHWYKLTEGRNDEWGAWTDFESQNKPVR